MKRVLALVIALTACGDDTGPGTPDAPGGGADAGGGGTLLSINVGPADYRFVVENGVQENLQYRAIGTYSDGSTIDITDQVIWASFDAALVNVNSSGVATTSAAFGGMTIIQATKGTIIGQTGATVVQRAIVIGPGVPADVQAQFDAAELDATPGRAPAIMYPTDQTVLPPNFPGLEFQYLDGTGNTLYELAMVDGYQEYRQYATCQTIGAGGCAVSPPTEAWTTIATKFTGKDVPVTVTGLGGTPASKATSSPRTMRFIGENLDAGLYYWAANTGTLSRFDFGHAGVPPELFYTAVGGSCVGCHALSRDGTLAAIGIDSPSPSGLHVVDVATKAILWQGGYGTVSGSNYHAFSPDSTMLLTTDGYTLQVRDSMTGAVLPFGNLSIASLFPDWSPDGGTILYTDIGGGFCSGSPCSTFTTSTGSLAVRSFDGTAFGVEQTIVQYDGLYNNYYPAFTPDSAWVVFNRVEAGAMWGMDSYDNRDCKLWAVSTAGTAPLELAAANGGYRGNTWPKVAPSMKPYANGTGSVAFFTFTSRRPIGIRAETGTSQVWMAAYDPARAELGLDPSFPAVHLPWQETSSANHIAQWATDIPHDPCGPMGECPTGEFCEGGECVPDID